MKRTQVAALLAGAALGLAGVTAATILLSRKEGRETARKLIAKTQPVAEQARKAGERVVKSATEQYQVIAPKAAGVVQTVRDQAPRAVETVTGIFPRVPQNGKHESTEVHA
jgi:hypothetical protein